MQFGIVNDPAGFVGFLEALKQENLLKVLAEPNLVTVSGRPASYLVGGQMPYPQPTGFGNISIAFRDFGTQIDFVPIVLGNGSVRLEVRPRVSEIDPTLSISVAGTTVPGFRMREVDTGVELKFGQTLAIAGLLQQRTVMTKRGIPYLMDVPYLGAAFSRKANKINEVELLIMVRPELVEGMDPDQVPPCGPGMTSMSPDDCDLYWKGYMEVPINTPHGPGHGPVGPMAARAGASRFRRNRRPPRSKTCRRPGAAHRAPAGAPGGQQARCRAQQRPAAVASRRTPQPVPGRRALQPLQSADAAKPAAGQIPILRRPGSSDPVGYDVRN